MTNNKVACVCCGENSARLMAGCDSDWYECSQCHAEWDETQRQRLEVQAWIKCSDRLPEMHKDTDVHYAHRVIVWSDKFKSGAEVHYESVGFHYREGHANYWHPMPKLPLTREDVEDE